jgi:putative SOS response-associated peptidase YedK
VETIETKPFFRDAFKTNRCIIPRSGYYEWEDMPAGKQPHDFTRKDVGGHDPRDISWSARGGNL